MADLRDQPLVVRSEEKVHPARMKLEPVRRVYLDCEQAAPGARSSPHYYRPSWLHRSLFWLRTLSRNSTSGARVGRRPRREFCLGVTHRRVSETNRMPAASLSRNGANTALRNAANAQGLPRLIGHLAMSNCWPAWKWPNKLRSCCKTRR